jgi:hypothetical protein
MRNTHLEATEEDWDYVLEALNRDRDETQNRFTQDNTPESLFRFWVEYRDKERSVRVEYRNMYYDFWISHRHRNNIR